MTTPTIGQPVYVTRSTNNFPNYRLGHVTKVSASGQITVALGEQTMRFCKNGQEIGVSKYHGHYLNFYISAVQAAIERQERQKATNAKVAEIMAGLADLRTGLGDYIVNADTKAKLLALVAGL